MRKQGEVDGRTDAPPPAGAQRSTNDAHMPAASIAPTAVSVHKPVSTPTGEIDLDGLTTPQLARLATRVGVELERRLASVQNLLT